MRINLQRRIAFDTALPRWFGVAWTEGGGNVLVISPLPFNLLAMAMRKIYLFFKYAGIEASHSARQAYHESIEKTFPGRAESPSESKEVGIDLERSHGSASEFVQDLASTWFVETEAALFSDVYLLYRNWCERGDRGSPERASVMAEAIDQRPEFKRARKRYECNAGRFGPHSVVLLRSSAQLTSRELGDWIQRFRKVAGLQAEARAGV